MPDLTQVDYVHNIKESGLTIYDPIKVGAPDLWIPSPELEVILNESLSGISLQGLAIRTRSKVVKEKVCTALGYPIPKSFQKCQPRFPGQNFDTYVQKSNNLQVWNEELSSTRRYVLIQVSEDDEIVKVRVVTGETLAILDTTGTLTQKYQARLIPNDKKAELISPQDTDRLSPIVKSFKGIENSASPTDHPDETSIIPIQDVFEQLQSLIDKTFPDLGYDQERNRGAALHRLVCETLGYKHYRDDGRFPDVRHQLLEVKLQTSPTIDLGLVCPNSEEPLDIPQMAGKQIRHCDVRYALFYGHTDGKIVTVTHLFLTTGRDFFSRFTQFQGKVLNKKLQIPLPQDFFNSDETQ